MAFVEDYKPSAFSRPHMTLTDVQRMADHPIELYNGSIATIDTGRTDQRRGSLRIVIDPDEQHMVRGRRSEAHPAAGVLIVAACDHHVQMSRFLQAAPRVEPSEVEEIVGMYKRLLRPAVELAARVHWAVELAELRQLHDYAQRNPSDVEVHRHRYPGVVHGGPRQLRIDQLESWLATPELYPVP